MISCPALVLIVGPYPESGKMYGAIVPVVAVVNTMSGSSLRMSNDVAATLLESGVLPPVFTSWSSSTLPVEPGTTVGLAGTSVRTIPADAEAGPTTSAARRATRPGPRARPGSSVGRMSRTPEAREDGNPAVGPGDRDRRDRRGC